MSNPFELLAVTPLADDPTIKSAYLAKVREFPPDHYPQHFQAIREAYEQIKDQESRLAYELFEVDIPDITMLWQAFVSDQTAAQRPSLHAFRQLIKTSAEHYSPVIDQLPDDQ